MIRQYGSKAFNEISRLTGSRECRNGCSYLFKHVYPTSPWATGGFKVVTGKLPLSLPSPRVLDPAPLEVSRVYIAFSKAYRIRRELPKVRSEMSHPVLSLRFLQNNHNNPPARTHQTQSGKHRFFVLFPFVSSLAPPAAAGHRPATEITTFTATRKIRTIRKRQEPPPA